MRAFVIIAVVLLSACSGWRGAPDWTEKGTSSRYPAESFLVGVGQADSRQAAEERAYANVARIFKAEITAQSRDWESFLVLEKKGQSNTERRLTLDQVTKVTTDKVLDNVRVLETWRDGKTGFHYALAGMDRKQAATALMERMSTLDQDVSSELAEARSANDKLTQVRNLRRAIKNLILREAYNADLRVVRATGQGLEAPYRVAELTAELEQFLAENVSVGVEVAGEQADLTRRAVIEGLIREGLPIAASTEAAAKPVELVVSGRVGLWDLTMPDPRFRYARWCSDFVVTERGGQRVVGAVSIGGREGHVNSAEARSRAVRVMQQELTSHLAKTLAAYIYGETDPPSELPPAACPNESAK